jgi:GT2 family glycosyltransferase
MITIIYSTHKDETYNKNFKTKLINSVGVKDVQILEYINKNEYSLAEIYNKGIKESVNNIIVCCHNDIKLENNWGKKLLKDFNDNPDYGIIGKAGSCYFPESGIYWERMQQTMVGQVYHHPQGSNKWLSQYSAKLPFLIPVVTIDGLIISFDKTKIKHLFDESIGRFHFYDHLFCLPNFLDGIKIGVTSSFEITHESVGQPNQEFWDSKEKFIKKWGDKLPLDLKPEKIFVEKINKNKLGPSKKVAVIIPTKSKLNILFNCLESFIENCDSDYFEIFIADTGSSDEEKKEIKNFIQQNQSKTIINLIEYDYYNFAKINNDVVKNHVSDNFELLLFCNNDIKIMNDVISEMSKVFKENKNTGTVGARLYFENNTIQHDGIIMLIKQDPKIGNILGVTHDNLNSYYKYKTNTKEVLGSTGALLMIRKNVFIKCGMFNENYINCFEDVELNLKCVILGFKNYFSGKSVAYHYESSTRNEDPDNLKKLNEDYVNNLVPFVNSNFNKLKDKILYTK